MINNNIMEDFADSSSYQLSQKQFEELETERPPSIPMRGDFVIGNRVVNIPLLTASAILGLGIGVGTGLAVVDNHKSSIEKSINECAVFEDEQICEAKYRKNMALIELTNDIRESIFGSK
ncbi:hypothetical protein GF340_00070 [Candidatus Peregrinibacteria bacterium]|nr:hypothetical protein [Candidatus Peregrinibacteria bacterium]